MNKRVVIHSVCDDEHGVAELRDKLESYGYSVCDENDFDLEIDYMVDPRSPEYRGIKSIISYFDTKHHDKWVEWNQMHSNKVCSIVQDDDGECYT